MPNTYYFNNAVDTAWDTIGNWWSDASHTIPAAGSEIFNIAFIDKVGSGVAGKYISFADKNGPVYAWFNITGAADPAPGGRGIAITGLSPSSTDAQIAVAFSNIIGADSEFSTSHGPDDVTVTNLVAGARTDPTSDIADFGSMLEVTQQGYGPSTGLPEAGDTAEIDGDLITGPSTPVTLAKINVNYGEMGGLIGAQIDLTAISTDSELKSGGAISGGGVVAKQTGGANNGLVLGDITGGLNDINGTVNGDMKGSTMYNYGVIIGDQSTGLSMSGSTIGSLSGGECDGHCLGDMTGGLIDWGGIVDGDMSGGTCNNGTLNSISGGTINSATILGNVTGGSFLGNVTFKTNTIGVFNVDLSGLTLTADAATVTFDSSVVLGGTTYVTINGGSFIGTPGPGITFDNNSSDGAWDTVGNWIDANNRRAASLPENGASLFINGTLTTGPSTPITAGVIQVGYGDGVSSGVGIDLTAISSDSVLVTGGVMSSGSVARMIDGNNYGSVIGNMSGGYNYGTVGSMSGGVNNSVCSGNMTGGENYGSVGGSMSSTDASSQNYGTVTGNMSEGPNFSTNMSGGVISGDMQSGVNNPGGTVNTMSGGWNDGTVSGDMTGGVNNSGTIPSMSGGENNGYCSGNMNGGTNNGQVDGYMNAGTNGVSGTIGINMTGGINYGLVSGSLNTSGTNHGTVVGTLSDALNETDGVIQGDMNSGTNRGTVNGNMFDGFNDGGTVLGYMSGQPGSCVNGGTVGSVLNGMNNGLVLGDMSAGYNYGTVNGNFGGDSNYATVLGNMTGGYNSGSVAGDMSGGTNASAGHVGTMSNGTNQGFVDGDMSGGLNDVSGRVYSMSGGDNYGVVDHDMTGGNNYYDVEGNMTGGTNYSTGFIMGTMTGGTNAAGAIVYNMSGGDNYGICNYVMSGGISYDGASIGSIVGGSIPAGATIKITSGFDCPTAANIRAGYLYGSCAVPSPSNVKKGISVDNTIGTLENPSFPASHLPQHLDGQTRQKILEQLRRVGITIS